jgi:DNA-binding XRE family transcriptional regulator
MYPKPNLIQLRKNSHVTQNEMARSLNITPRHYKSLEGGNSDGSVKIWQQLAQKFNTTVDCLLQHEATEPSNFNTDAEAVKERKSRVVAVEGRRTDRQVAQGDMRVERHPGDTNGRGTGGRGG